MLPFVRWDISNVVSAVISRLVRNSLVENSCRTRTHAFASLVFIRLALLEIYVNKIIAIITIPIYLFTLDSANLLEDIGEQKKN